MDYSCLMSLAHLKKEILQYGPFDIIIMSRAYFMYALLLH